MKAARLLCWLCLLLPACSTLTRYAPVQERSTATSRETVPPVLGRQGTAGASGAAGPSGSARAPAAPPPPRPPGSSAIAGLAPPQPVGNADEPVAVATPLRGDGGAAPAPARSASAAAAARPATPAAGATGLPGLEWSWPVDTPIVQGYTESTKGVDFTGALGQPVRAAAAGVVSYVGSSLRGYGQMVVIKHDKGYLSVYAHNRQILVKEGQRVERGQRIAEMGNSDSKDVILHFEVRHQGRPLDPAQTLPGR